MIIRHEIPSKTNKYYLTLKKGGYSPCIDGYPSYCDGSVLANCVGLAFGRWNESQNKGTSFEAWRGNAENLIDNRPSKYRADMIPEQGALMVWQRGATKNEEDGAGHVEFVEKVINENCVYTSASGYGGTIYYNAIRFNEREWEKGSPYKFLGFIHQNNMISTTLLEDWQTVAKQIGIYKGAVDNWFGDLSFDASNKVKLAYGYDNDLAMLTFVQKTLNMYNYYDGAIGDGIFGNMTYNAVYQWQIEHSLVVDGWVGGQTIRSLLGV